MAIQKFGMRLYEMMELRSMVKDINTYVNPSGSYQTYSQITNEKDNELASKLNSLEVRID